MHYTADTGPKTVSFPLLVDLRALLFFFFFSFMRKVVVQFKGLYIDHTKSSKVSSEGNSIMLSI